MPKFITGGELEKAVCDIIWEAKETLLIVSPFIKLDNFFVKLFQNHLANPKVHLLIVFGKNEVDKSKSLNKGDFDFFKTFPKVSIIYVPNLHAKYYGNESKGVITSINLYDYSFKNNIEFGVYSEVSILDTFTQSSDKEAWNKCREIADMGEPLFIKRPVFKRKILGKDYMSSTAMLDNTDSFYNGNSNLSGKKLKDFPEDLDFSEQPSERPTREYSNLYQSKNEHVAEPSIAKTKVAPDYMANNNARQTGYCIRTGVEIPFNPQRPYSESAFRSWNQYKNANYRENFCHKTGKDSKGKTSMNNPILE